MRPFVLRRMKADVEKSVPPKEETVVHVELTAVQKQWCDGTLLGHGAHSHTAAQLSSRSSLYYRYRAIYERNVAFLTMEGRAAAPSLMNVVMELRKCCNHPFLIEGAEAQILAQARGTSHTPIPIT